MLIADPLQWDQVTSHQAVTWNSSAMKLNRAGVCRRLQALRGWSDGQRETDDIGAVFR
jgi:hypothetical protein